MTVEIDITRDGDIGEIFSRLGDSLRVDHSIEKALNGTARVMQSFAELNAPKDTRRLVSEIHRDDADHTASGAIQARVGVSPVERLARGGLGPMNEKESDYPFFVHQGTGIYGAARALIRPKRAKAMLFFGRTGLVVARTVRGQKPQPYMGEAFHESLIYIPHALDEIFSDLVDDR
jgi:hypothetical protein